MYVTVVVPTGKVEPLVWVEVTVATPQLSVIVGSAHVTTAEQVPGVTLTVISLRPEIVGAVLSLIVTLKLWVVMFPAASVSVYVTTVVPTGKKLPLVCDDVIAGVPQLSVLPGVAHVTVRPHEAAMAVVFEVMLPGNDVKLGAILSIILTSNDPVAVLPDGSVTVYVTVVVPTGKKSPGLCELLMVKLQLSLPVGGVHVTTAPQTPASTFCMISDGTPEIVGSISSTMVTVNELVAIFPFTSVAVYVTVVTPAGKVEPLA